MYKTLIIIKSSSINNNKMFCHGFHAFRCKFIFLLNSYDLSPSFSILSISCFTCNESFYNEMYISNWRANKRGEREVNEE